MNERSDPAAGAAEGQLAQAIDIVNMIYGPDEDGRHVGVVASLVAAIRADRARALATNIPSQRRQ